jgi:hypothetical protein
MNIKYYECVRVALDSQHAVRLGSIVLSPVACTVLYIFSHYHINGTIFGGKCVEQKMCIDFLCNFFSF